MSAFSAPTKNRRVAPVRRPIGAVKYDLRVADFNVDNDTGFSVVQNGNNWDWTIPVASAADGIGEGGFAAIDLADLFPGGVPDGWEIVVLCGTTTDSGTGEVYAHASIGDADTRAGVFPDCIGAGVMELTGTGLFACWMDVNDASPGTGGPGTPPSLPVTDEEMRVRLAQTTGSGVTASSTLPGSVAGRELEVGTPHLILGVGIETAVTGSARTLTMVNPVAWVREIVLGQP